MLRELSVAGLGVIEEITVDLHPKMTALTGETGAGKTLVVEALQLLAGSRADPGLVRPGSSAAIVQGRFEAIADPGGLGIPFDLDADPEIILAREVPAEGRSRAWVGGRMATAAALAGTGRALLDLHGQHDHLSLTTAAGQRAALDAFAGTDVSALQAARAELSRIEETRARLGGGPGELEREAEFLRFQIDELDRAALGDSGEETRLEDEEEVLASAAADREAARTALSMLGASDPDSAGPEGPSASDGIAGALAALSGQPRFAPVAGRLRALSEELSDTAHELRVALETVIEDPERLAEVRARRQLLFDIARKYGGSLEAAHAFTTTARDRLAEIEDHDARSRELEDLRDRALAAVAAAEEEVRRTRAVAAPKLAAAATAVLRTLAMPHATIGVSVGDAGPGDEVVFLLGANPGEPALPLAKVASGGELARTTLSLRLVTSGGPPTLVFDEVDAGVGGEAALAVGRALAALSENHQVIVVTHLAQVAAFADHQVVVTKTAAGERTVATARPVEGTDRVVELSRMLSGQPGSTTARRHAEELLESAAAMRGGGLRR